MDTKKLEVIGRLLELLNEGVSIIYCTDLFNGSVMTLTRETSVGFFSRLIGYDLIEKEDDCLLPHWGEKFPKGYDFETFIDEDGWLYQYALPTITK